MVYINGTDDYGKPRTALSDYDEPLVDVEHVLSVLLTGRLRFKIDRGRCYRASFDYYEARIEVESAPGRTEHLLLNVDNEIMFKLIDLENSQNRVTFEVTICTN